jgi:hypothetical protein
MSSDDYQAEFDRQVELHHYPIKVEGRSTQAGSLFRALFVPYPSDNFIFDSRHYMDETYFREHSAELLAQGYTRICLNTFIDEFSTKRYIATWIKQ